MKTKKLFFILILFLLIWIPLLIRSSSLWVEARTSSIVYVQNDNKGGFYGNNIGDEDKSTQALTKLLRDGQGIVNGLIGIGILSSIAAFSYQAFMLGKSDDPRARSTAINQLIVIAITTAALGGFPLIWNLILSIIS